MATFTYADIVRRAWSKHKELYPMDGYFSLVSLHGMARFAKFMKDGILMDELKSFARPYLDGNIERMCGAYGASVYRFGGNFTAYLAVRGDLSEADVQVMVRSAEMLCNQHERAENGVFQMPGKPGFHWIDTVFGICPFLVWTGLAANRQDFIDEACFQMKKHHEILFDPKLNSYFQAINFDGSGELTPAHWSRGVGWGVYALAEMVYDLPKNHPDYDSVLSMFRTVMDGCLPLQDKNGMWHQAVEDHNTYVETSGTALIAYAMARGIKNGSLDAERFSPAFLNALKGLATYIAVDGSVFNCCMGCLAPGKGTVEDYDNRRWVLNDPHAFGPIILAYGEAQHLQPLGLVEPLENLLS